MNGQDDLDAAERELRNAISGLGLSSLAAEIAHHLAMDPLGIRREAAPSLAASWTAQTQDMCTRAIVELLARKVIIETGSDQRLQVDYAYLGIAETVKAQLISREPPFKLYGHPHSLSSMTSLETVFREEEGPLYVGLQITSPRVFRNLEERAQKRRLTVFLIPRRADVPHDRREHYDEMRREWFQLIKRGSAHLKENVRILRVASSSPEIYTSLLTKSTAHLDLYVMESRTTREGEMIEASVGSSLYALVERSFREIAYRSPPLFKLWPCEYLCFRLRRLWIAAIGLFLAIVCLAYGGAVVAACGALFMGIAANDIHARLREMKWHPPELFTR